MTTSKDSFPDRPAFMLPYMISNNWLCAYKTIEGIDSVMRGMARRAKYDSGMERSGEVLKLHYNEFEKDFRLFFPELKRSVHEFLERYTD
jgi:acyl carrier protein phosphodiesterase